MAYAELSAQAPNHPNFVKIKFGFKRSNAARYTVLTGQSGSGLGWRVRVDNLTPGTEYDFIAYSENAYGLLSQIGNPTITKTTLGGDQFPDWVGVKGMMGFPVLSELVISTGEVIVIEDIKFRFHSIDTEGNAASDDLDTIKGGNEGELLLIQAENAARVVTLKDGTSLKMEGDFALESTEDKILFICISEGVWHEIMRSKALGFPSPTELTIASGVIVLQGKQNFRFHNIDTESNAASDDLDSVSGGNVGEILILQTENDARTVVIKDSVYLQLEGDFTMDSGADKIQLICYYPGTPGYWHELSRSNNGA